jgi:uncharacterized protein
MSEEKFPTCRIDDSHAEESRASMQDVLRSSKVIAVVGLSSNRMRPSYGVAEYLKASGYRIIPVNPNEREVLGVRAVGRLEDVSEKVDIVDIFRRSEFVGPIVDSAIAIGARAIWMQEGVVDDRAAKKAREAGLFVAVDSCIAKDLARVGR